MKTSILSFLIIILIFPIEGLSQIKIYQNNNIKIGDISNPLAPASPLFIDYETRFRCLDANGNGGPGLLMTNYQNNFGAGGIITGSTYNDPIILPFFTNSVWLGNSNNNFWQIYGYDIWAQGNLLVPSDVKFKSNITSINDPLSTLGRLNPVRYDFHHPSDTILNEERELYIKQRGKDNFGFIAQELQVVLPTLVVQSEDNYLGINYIGLIPILVSAIQEQNNKIEILQKEIETLKNR